MPDRCSREKCEEEATVRIHFTSARSKLFCVPHADAKCFEAEKKGVFLTQEALPNYDPDVHGGWY